jgi:hypothetical protein
MKAVIYHADCRIAKKRGKEGLYKDLILGLKKNLQIFQIPLIHITLEGFEAYGDMNFFYKGDPEEVNYNRELFFIDFLKNHAEDDEVYFFTEPDTRINNMFPELEGDASFTVHRGEQRIAPQWRLAKKSALPIFEKAFSFYREDKKFWGGDTEIWGKFYSFLRYPDDNVNVQYENLIIQLRPYKWYNMTGSHFTQQFKSNRKNMLADREKEKEKKL